MNPKTFLRLIVGFSILLIGVVIFLYVKNFHETPISMNTQDWGTFGDYFGGILNPVISILNLGVLIYITFQIAENENIRSKNELLIQKQIALYGLKHDALKELNQILGQVQPELVKSEKDSQLKLVLLRNDFNSFIDTYTYLFPFFEDMTWQPLRDSILAISEIANRQYQSGYKLNTEKEVMPELEKYNTLKSEFLTEVQNKILE